MFITISVFSLDRLCKMVTTDNSFTFVTNCEQTRLYVCLYNWHVFDN